MFGLTRDKLESSLNCPHQGSTLIKVLQKAALVAAYLSKFFYSEYSFFIRNVKILPDCFPSHVFYICAMHTYTSGLC